MFFLKADGYINQKTGEIVHDLYTVEAPASHDRYYKSSYFGSNFIWVTPLCLQQFQQESPAFIAKLAYLSSWINYRQVLMTRLGTKMTKQDIMDLLGDSKRNFYNFWNYAVEQGYIIYNEDCIAMSASYFFKGSVSVKEKFLGTDKQKLFRMFVPTIRQLYEMKPEVSRATIGYYFKCLCWVHPQVNILCSNPTCTFIENIKPHNMVQLIEQIGLDKTNASRFKKALTAPILYNTRYKAYYNAIFGEEQSFPVKQEMLDLTLATIRKVYINNKAQTVICLNPNLCYAGYYPDIARRVGGFEKRILDDAPYRAILGDDVNWDASTKLLTENGIDAEGNVVLTEEDELPPCMGVYQPGDKPFGRLIKTNNDWKDETSWKFIKPICVKTPPQ